MTAPDEATRRRIDVELRLQADPLLMECARAVDSLLNMTSIWREWLPKHSTAYQDFESLPEISSARALLAKLRGEQP